MTDDHSPCGGVVLAGGRATRLDGRNKALLDIGDRPIIEHIIERATPQLRQLIISANSGARALAPFGLPVISDVSDTCAGPLAGIVSAMRWYRDHAPELSHLAVFPGDSPFFPPDLVEKLQATAREQDVWLVRVQQGGQPQPLFSLWSMETLPMLEQAIDDGVASPLRFINAQPHGLLHYPREEDSLLFANVNTQADWNALNRAVAGNL